ncbi:MAG: hypothetical protein O7J95_10195 [Planctomycetota bacterium]|nr:hypothetical protein [Planctomycetota bacterium]
MNKTEEFFVPRQPDQVPDMSADQAARFLRMGLSGAIRPVDELIQQLNRPGGAQWLEERLASELFESLHEARSQLLDGQITVEQLSEMKSKAKSLFASEHNRTARLEGTLGYFLAIAGGLAYHGKLLSTRSRDDLDFAFEDLSYALPEPWNALFHRAIEADES